MYYTDITSIVNNYLLEKNLSIHSFLRCLSFALRALKEIELDIVGKIHSETLTINDFNEIKLPCNYVDWVRIGQVNGQYVVNLGLTQNYNRKLNVLNGIQTTYPDPPASTSSFDFPYVYEWFDEHGEFTGRDYGGPGARIDEVMINEERGVISLSANLTGTTTIDLDYIAADTANADLKVHRYAEEVIHAFIDWKYKDHLANRRNYDIREAKENYYNALRILTARKSDFTPDMVRQIINKRFRQAVKL